MRCSSRRGNDCDRWVRAAARAVVSPTSTSTFPTCVHWAHEHSASKLIRRSIRLLPERYRVITATVDAMAGEIGTVYQAAGFDFVGVMRMGGRALVRVNGKAMSERQAGNSPGPAAHVRWLRSASTRSRCLASDVISPSAAIGASASIFAPPSRI